MIQVNMMYYPSFANDALAHLPYHFKFCTGFYGSHSLFPVRFCKWMLRPGFRYMRPHEFQLFRDTSIESSLLHAYQGLSQTLLMLVAKCCYEENFTHFTCLPWLFILLFRSFPFLRYISCDTCMRLRGPRKLVTALLCPLSKDWHLHLFSPRYPFILSSPSILSSFPPFQSPFSSLFSFSLSFSPFPSFLSFLLPRDCYNIHILFILFQIVFDYSVVNYRWIQN